MAIILNNNQTTRPRSYAANLESSLEQAVFNVNRMVALGAEMTTAQREAAFDLQPGQGDLFAALVVALQTALNVAAVNNYLNRFVP